jgi:hypothetical protein
VVGGHVTNGPVAEFLGVECVDPLTALGDDVPGDRG